MKTKALRGTRDVLPPETNKWCFIEAGSRELFELYGYAEIRTPIIEEGDVFVRSIGDTTDIVQKQMYTFQDKRARSIALRPEATAGVVRAYLEHGLDKALELVKFYYIGPMFRSERPQAGRLRQFHHIGAEAIGSYSPYLDGEVISMLAHLLNSLGLRDFSIKLNSMGCQKDRAKATHLIKKSLASHQGRLCEDCNQRFKRNVFRVFDCKKETCQKIAHSLPVMKDFLCSDCSIHFQEVKNALDVLGVQYTFDPYLVRGLDYYAKTVFEVTHSRLGAQNAIGAGGRYDNLVAEMGGSERGAIGFALGLERMLIALDRSEVTPSPLSSKNIYIATVGSAAYKKGFELLDRLRRVKIPAQMDYQDRSLKGQMRAADKSDSRYVGIIGEDELKKDIVVLRDMSTGQQTQISIGEFAEEVKKRIKK